MAKDTFNYIKLLSLREGKFLRKIAHFKGPKDYTQTLLIALFLASAPGCIDITVFLTMFTKISKPYIPFFARCIRETLPVDPEHQHYVINWRFKSSRVHAYDLCLAITKTLCPSFDQERKMKQAVREFYDSELFFLLLQSQSQRFDITGKSTNTCNY